MGKNLGVLVIFALIGVALIGVLFFNKGSERLVPKKGVEGVIHPFMANSYLEKEKKEK